MGRGMFVFPVSSGIYSRSSEVNGPVEKDCSCTVCVCVCVCVCEREKERERERERQGDKNTDSALSQHWTGSRARGPSFHLRTIIHLKCPVGMCICVRGHPSLRGLQKCLPRPDILQFQTKPFPCKDLTYLHSMFECVCVCCVMEAEGLFKKVNEPPWILTVRVEYSGFSRSYA